MYKIYEFTTVEFMRVVLSAYEDRAAEEGWVYAGVVVSLVYLYFVSYHLYFQSIMHRIHVSYSIIYILSYDTIINNDRLYRMYLLL